MKQQPIRALVKAVQFKLGLTVEQVAEGIGYSRVHLSNEMKKKSSPAVEQALYKKYGEILQNVSHGTPAAQSNAKPNGENKPATGMLIDAGEYIDELKRDKRMLESLVKDNQDVIRFNLSSLQALLRTIFRHDLSYHQTMLRSLARIEKKNDADTLIVEADKAEAALLVEEMKHEDHSVKNVRS